MKKKQSKKIYCPYNKQTIVSINGKLCALQPGNTILFNDKDTMAKTIVDINIDIEDMSLGGGATIYVRLEKDKINFYTRKEFYEIFGYL